MRPVQGPASFIIAACCLLASTALADTCEFDTPTCLENTDYEAEVLQNMMRAARSPCAWPCGGCNSVQNSVSCVGKSREESNCTLRLDTLMCEYDFNCKQVSGSGRCPPASLVTRLEQQAAQAPASGAHSRHIMSQLVAALVVLAIAAVALRR